MKKPVAILLSGMVIFLAGYAALSGTMLKPSRLPFPFRSAAVSASDTQIPESTTMSRPQLPSNRVRAPEFPRNFAWVNTDRPLYIQERLKGRIVILDFWTYCCINCMHILPDLEYLERKYAGKPVVVIGVHSAKFDNESDEENILTACQRYDIAHPVIVDEQHRIWSEYGVQSWPTLAVIDAEGRVVGQLSGEGNREILDGVIQALLDEGREKGILAADAPEFNHSSRVPSASGLAFPGKVLAREDRVFIADSNHDRIVIADSSGKVLAIAGSGKKGASDGSFAHAEFDNPQGMAYDLHKDLLYVADTDNHLIRKLDLRAQTVTTICGTGQQVYDRIGGGQGTSQGLNSPWDVVLLGNTLYIAMAGPHQLWTLDLPSGAARAWAGSGREDIYDGTGTRSAALAQPSGLALDGDWLYFADSEVSAVRRANINSAEVQTLVGSGLFDFGDQSGDFKNTLLQHPLGVAVYKDDIFVADTYNHKIKRLNPTTKKSFDFIGSGSAGLKSESPGKLSLYEPGGLSVYGDWLYVADTNHDRVIRVSLLDQSWTVFELTGLRTMESVTITHDAVADAVVPHRNGSDLILSLGATLPDGVHLNKEAPIGFAIHNKSESILEGLAPKGILPARVTLSASLLSGATDLQAVLYFAYCTDKNAGLCVPVSVAWNVHLKADATAPELSDLNIKVSALAQ